MQSNLASNHPGVSHYPARVTGSPLSGNTFKVITFDCVFPGLAEGESLTTNDRLSSTTTVIACTLDGTIPPDGTKGTIYRSGRNWVFIYDTNTAPPPPGDVSIKLIRAKSASGGDPDCLEIDPNGNAIFECKLVTYNTSGTDTDLTNIAPTEGDDAFCIVPSNCVTNRKLKHNRVYWGYKQAQPYTKGAATRDVYVILKEAEAKAEWVELQKDSAGDADGALVNPDVDGFYNAKLVSQFTDPLNDGDNVTATATEDVWAVVTTPSNNVRSVAQYRADDTGRIHSTRSVYEIQADRPDYLKVTWNASNAIGVTDPGNEISDTNTGDGLATTYALLPELEAQFTTVHPPYSESFKRSGWKFVPGSDPHFVCEKAGYYTIGAYGRFEIRNIASGDAVTHQLYFSAGNNAHRKVTEGPTTHNQEWRASLQTTFWYAVGNTIRLYATANTKAGTAAAVAELFAFTMWFAAR